MHHRAQRPAFADIWETGEAGSDNFAFSTKNFLYPGAPPQAHDLAAVGGNAYFFNESGGVPVGIQALSFSENGGTAVYSLPSVSGLSGNKGSAQIAHTCGLGGLKAKLVALEPSTGFSFDTICSVREL